ncbi:MAG: acetate kinase, partial [Rhodobacteraceae bacterium]|nr:acetate kinase [Paracoccaceae bacterium]
TASAELTPLVLARARDAATLAPLHNPPAIAVIAAVARTRPGLRQIACFDTAFHATIPEVGWRYALPDLPETRGIRRYGFHGLSYASLAARLPAATGGPLPRRLLAAHLGNGASLCAIRDGRSVATTMGYSPLGGLTMGTRTGEIDGNAVLEIARRAGIDRASDILNRES